MTHAAEAVRLHALGYEPVRLIPGEKRPASSAWQQQRGRTTDEVAADFAAEGGLGLLTGGGLIVIDSDLKEGVSGQATLAELKARLGPLPATVTARTASGGYHYYFRVLGAVRVPNSAGKLGPGVDVRGDGGQVVAPPTALADGRSYAWLENMEHGAPSQLSVPAILPPKWLEAILAAPAPSPRPAAPAAPAGAERLVAPVTRAAGLARARAYLSAMPPAVAGQGGHGKTFDAACRAVQRATCEDDAWLALSEYNDRCLPPWSTDELRHKLDGAMAAHAFASALSEARASVALDGETHVVEAPDTDDLIDTITEADNEPYWRALRAYNRDHPEALLPEQLSQEQASFLKKTPQPPTGAPGRPPGYLRHNEDLLDFCGERPSQHAHDEHLRSCWRHLLSSGVWSDGAGTQSLDHRLENVGLNARSVKEFKRRVRHVDDALCVYDSTDRFAEVNGARVLNTYEPSTLQPEAGDWSALRGILLNLHSGSEEHLEWTLDWLATVMQDVRAGKPRLTGVAIVFYGPQQGAGKGVFETVLRALVGERNINTVGQEQLDDSFNAWASGKLLLIGNEVFSSENRTESQGNKVKPYISDSTIQIREMYASPRSRANVANLLFFANGNRPVVAEQQDRRFTMFKVGGVISPALGAKVAEDAREGGPIVRAFLHELLTRKPTRFHRFVPLLTEAKAEVQYDTSPSHEKFLHELVKGDGFHSLAAEFIHSRGGSDLYVRSEGEVLVERRVMYEVYRTWASASGYRPVAASQLFRLCRQAGMEDDRRRVNGQPVRLFAKVPGIYSDEREPGQEG